MANEYKEFMDAMQTAKVVEQSAKALVSGNEQERGNSRGALEQIINSMEGHHTVVPQDSDSSVLEFVPATIDYWQEIGFDRFGENPNGIISKARKDHESEFRKNYLAIAPIKIKGNDEHNKIVESHTVHYVLTQILKKYQDSEQKEEERVEFINKTAGIIGENVRWRLQRMGAPEKAVRKLTELAVDRYFAHPELTVHKSKYALGDIQNRIEKMVPENERADYATRMLKALAEKGGDALKLAAESTYKLVSTKS